VVQPTELGHVEHPGFVGTFEAEDARAEISARIYLR
jgi:hypothetical protein